MNDMNIDGGGIEKSEKIYLVLSLLFMALLSVLINVESIRNKISSLNPLWQFLIINIGTYFIFFVLFKFIAKGDSPIWEVSIANVLIFMAMDLMQAPFAVTAQGLQVGQVYGMSGLDYVIGYLYSSAGITGWLLWVMVYPITFLILFIAGSLLFKDFVRRI